MENTWKKRLGGGSDHGGGMSWGHDPHFLAVWRSKEVAVHLYIHPLFLPACWLQRLHATVSC